MRYSSVVCPNCKAKLDLCGWVKLPKYCPCCHKPLKL